MASTEVTSDPERGGSLSEVGALQSGPHKASAVPESQRAVLSFRDVRFTVSQSARGKPATEKAILDGVSGVVRPGEILFVMGPSGSGKTTLLSALADRIAHQPGLVADVRVNGKPRAESDWEGIHAFVQQEDAMYGSLTVRETLEYAAQLQLGRQVSRVQVQQRVDEVLHTLGLAEAQHTLVGSPFFRGISGGQKRRLSVGVEIMRYPSILFLDEPTSGLDATAAYQLVLALRNIARMGVALVITIHQPSARVLALSDRLLMLARGRTVYFGPTAHTIDYFTEMGCPVPAHENAAEFFLDCTNADFVDEQKVERILQSWPIGAERQQLETELEAVERGDDAPTQLHIEVAKVPRWYQVLVLSRRNVMNYVRNPAAVMLRMAMYVALSVFLGLVYLRLGKDQIQDISKVLFFVAAFLTFMSVSTVVMFIEERLVFLRERGNGLYTVDAWLTANTVVSLPVVFLLSLVNSSIVYWMVGLTPLPGRFFFFMWNLFLMLAVAEALMLFISILVPIAILAIAMGAAAYGAFMLTGGFFAAFSNIGWWVRWIGYLSLHTYGFGSFMANNFNDQTGYSYTVVGQTVPLTGGEVLSLFDILFTNIWLNSGVLIAMIAIYRLCAYMALRFVATGRK
ncbi:hypothetical protein CDCA_CDCA14G3892 [Cyanidium caldarium]|uniref:Probable ATP-dependent transporter ycf16 n=1 Tax=Cyanidium caldarium TaxID=2771 RepID=A0AAV9IZW3_CYACA|nr:hypothetical protein CDCA_CDCA14G3892 [Cyanidium caldarium]